MEDSPRILWVTSCNPQIFQVSGRNLIKSFSKTKQLGTLLICRENFKYNSNHKNIITFPLHKYVYLKSWLTKNKKYIPTELGGTAKGSKMTYWNKNASRWFRKVASLHYALETYGSSYDYIIWVDSDVTFKKHIPLKIHLKALEEAGVFYFLGGARRKSNYGFETGLLGFNLKNGGNTFLGYCFQLYDSGAYRKFKRWDDGYIFRMVDDVYNKGEIKAVDLGISNKHNVLNNNSIYHPYVRHDKGVHVRKGLFKK